MNDSNRAEIRILLHAPTAGALARARSSVASLAQAAPQATLGIVADADAVAALLDAPDPAADALTLVCAHTLARLGRSAAEPLTALPEGAVLALVRMQLEGWHYIRA